MNPNEQAPVANVSPNSQKKVGPIVVVLVIVLVLIVTALYLFASKISDQSTLNTDNNTALTNNEAAVMIPVETVTNTSDELQSLQNDLDVSTNGLDTQNF